MTDDRLGSWKEIAAYLGRDVTTAQRWEKREAMPVHRHQHDRLGSVYAFRSELDAWRAGRHPLASPDGADIAPAAEASGATGAEPDAAATTAAAPRRARGWPLLVAALTATIAAGGVWALRTPVDSSDLLAGARYDQLTTFGGAEQAAAISRDGRFVAFLSDRDGRVDVWVTHVGTGQFHNLTRGRTTELVNPAVRALGFTPDGTLVTFWARRGPQPEDIGVWAIPTLGGAPRPYLEGVAELAWSPGADRLAYHTPEAGDPLYVADDPTAPRGAALFSAPTGEHAHFPTWSPDGRFIYFVQGSLPDRLDLWRLPLGRATQPPERVTHHGAAVSHPVFIDADRLLYLVGDPDGDAAGLYVLDPRRPAPTRVPVALARFTSAAASADGRRIAATVARPHESLWRITLDGDGAGVPVPLSLPAGRIASPRIGRDGVLYVAAAAEGDGIVRLADGTTTTLWTGRQARIAGLDIAARSGQVAFTVEQSGRTSIHVMQADGTGAREIAAGMALHGPPAWTPDGTAVTCGAGGEGAGALVRIPLHGAPSTLVAEFAVGPAWSADGEIVAYSGADVGTTFPLRAATAAGRPFPVPALSLTRGARRLRFLDGRGLVSLRGDITHKDLWLTDVTSGAERRLVTLPAGFEIRDFDISPDGRTVVVQRVEARSDIALIELPRR